MKKLLPLSFLLQFGCLDQLLKTAEDDEEKEEKEENNERREGEQVGDCTDGLDNDEDGDIDCDDSGCSNKPACEDQLETDTATEPDDPEDDPEDTAEDTAEDQIEPLIPLAIGFEFSGIWDEAGNDGAGELKPYLFPDLNNTNGGEPLALSHIVQVTLASSAYFSLGSDATDEQRENETCTVYAWFDNAPAEISVENFNWMTGNGSAGSANIEVWQGFEGTLILNLDSASARCNELADGYSLDMFDAMHFGIVLGELSEYMRGQFEATDWWESDLDAQNSYFTQYIAVNHGTNFTAYDWTSSIFVAADAEECSSDTCGLIQTETVSGATNYLLGDVSQNIGSRYGYIQGNAWWYEDLVNLDVNTLQDW